jgi:hypothetical protein
MTIETRRFFIDTLQFSKYGEVALLFTYSESHHYNSSFVSNMAWYTPGEVLDPPASVHGVIVFWYGQANPPPFSLYVTDVSTPLIIFFLLPSLLLHFSNGVHRVCLLAGAEGIDGGRGRGHCIIGGRGVHHTTRSQRLGAPRWRPLR